ncbi:NAD-dependent epimerase/dehydratase family protein [Rhodanobacter lindaniclasticus]
MASRSETSRLRVLLTGRNGFTGHYIAAELESAGHEVFGLDRLEGDDKVHVDLLDRDAVRTAVDNIAPDVVIHLAAIAFVAHGDVDAIYRVNIVGTRNLLDALAATPVQPRLVVLASSANVYGNADIEPITEAVPPAPVNDYAVSKLAMEYAARLWMDRLPIVVVRPFNYTGVGQSKQFLIPKIVDHFQRKAQVIELGNTAVARDFSDVRDVARAYLAIVRAAPVGEVLNICSGVGYSLDDVLGMMAEIAGYRIRVEVNPAFVRSSDVARLVGSPARLATLTGWSAQYPLMRTLAWQYAAAGT